MPNTFELIASSTVGSGGAANIAFTSIPSTFTDLCLVLSTRSTSNDSTGYIQFNADTGANYSWRRLLGNGSGASSDANTTYGSPYNTFIPFTNAQSALTASTFNNANIYIPNYAGSTQKSASVDSVNENNATSAEAALWAGLWTGTAAISSIRIFAISANLAQHSTAYLYGVKNA